MLWLFAPGSVEIGFAVFAADHGTVACFQQMEASGAGQGRAEVRVCTQEGHAAPKIARVVRFEPQAAAAVRAGVTVARHVAGKQRGPMAQSFYANRVGRRAARRSLRGSPR